MFMHNFSWSLVVQHSFDHLYLHSYDDLLSCKGLLTCIILIFMVIKSDGYSIYNHEKTISWLTDVTDDFQITTESILLESDIG